MVPTYAVVEAGKFLRLPEATVRSWVVGRPYPTKHGERFFRGLVTAEQAHPLRLSFLNVVELHVLASVRRVHRVPLDKVRTALDYVERRLQIKRPLARQVFYTDGMDLFVREFGSLTNVSQKGQLELREAMEAHLERIERDEAGLAIQLYPFTRKSYQDNPRWIVIDPRLSFGQPALAGRGIPTSVLADRYKAGERIGDLAADYDCEPDLVEEAIRSELPLAA